MLRDRLFAGGGALSRSIPARTPPLSPPRCVVAATLGVCDRTVRRLTPAAICPPSGRPLRAHQRGGFARLFGWRPRAEVLTSIVPGCPSLRWPL